MGKLKSLLSVLITGTVICSATALQAFAANEPVTDIYDSTIFNESKESDSEGISSNVWAVGSSSDIKTDVTEPVVEAVSETPFNVFDIYDAHQKYVKLHSGDPELMYRKSEGIDVSYAQGKIDWKAVKDSGIDFAIIRAGYGNAKKYPNQIDTWFKYNITEAQKVGMDIGIYWYSYAYDVEAARDEAEGCYQIIKDYNITYPVYFDIEEEKHKKLSAAEVSAIIDTFCSTIESKGYHAGIYSFTSLLSTKVYKQVLDKYAVWVAHWNVNAPAFSGDYGMWQYNAVGRVNGISTDVDLDHCYINYPYIISPDTYNPEGAETSISPVQYPASTEKVVAKGIDVSVWQAKIDWDKVAKSDVDYAIIRAGYGNLSSQKDKYFEANIDGAAKAGIDCGVYWYSYASSPEDAVLEAEACYEVIKNRKYAYPVYYSLEDVCLNSLSNKELSDIAKAFCSTLEKKGYYVGIKSNVNFLSTRLDESLFKSYDVWVAHYGVSKPGFNKNYNMWQYSSTGKVNGINGIVNCDYAYINFPKVMKEAHLNGF
ncbi:MAG: glycoside hydrolase family 25 protein [Ruminococcus sp.]|uniref:glycoside hydrolase family 25 protein n=1 Tax=Ruminococcus sp. TaxID=41978 RepID=UPI0025CBF127|nr:glycoside hydrolase family 25 protein [Ruminococcus sp.]MCR4795189.1 glycoside hydrolase family 25 protein [Ruminococcus sp.]